MLNREEVKKIATLARIGLKEEEVERYQKDLSAVLDYFKELEKMDSSQIEPIGHITGMTDVYDEDQAVEFGSLGREAILKNAPENKDKYFKVKSVL